MKNGVIIIDDHKLFSEGLELILKDSDRYRVLAKVFDSRQAEYQIKLHSPDLILMDYNMPHLNGLELLKMHPEIVRDSKVVIISMYADKSEINMFKKQGVNGYLSKTIPGEKLIESLGKIMEGENLFLADYHVKHLPVIDEVSLKSKITKREMDILMELKKGHTTEKIAQTLNLSYLTVQTHRRNINHKLNIASKRDLYKIISNIEDEDSIG